MIRNSHSSNSLRGLQKSSSKEATCPPPTSCVCNATSPADRVTLKFLVPEIPSANFTAIIEAAAIDYRRIRGSGVEILVTGIDKLWKLQKKIRVDVQDKAGQFDGYILNPAFSGELAVKDGAYDLTNFIKNYSRNPNYWAGILPFYREVLATYDGKILMLPLDGDVHSLFYRKDLLTEHNKTVPKTWDEYTEVANYFHGMQVEHPSPDNMTNITLAGSCIGRAKNCGGGYWAQLILSSLTQYEGSVTGSLFDSRDMKPLLGVAMEETLRILEEQAKVGSYDEFNGCVSINVAAMNRGECVLTYNWGNSFTEHTTEGSLVRGKLGVANTPGSTQVLDRNTGRLVDCTTEICPFSEQHVNAKGNTEYINQAPYAANGGWLAAISNNVSPEQKEAAADFMAFLTDTTQSTKYVIPGQTIGSPPLGVDPYRNAHLNPKEWIERGFPKEATIDYLNAIESQLSSGNVVVDCRFPQAADILDRLDHHTWTYLNDTVIYDKVPLEFRKRERKERSDNLRFDWVELISEYDRKTKKPIIEIYQKFREVYVAPKSSGKIISKSMSTEAIAAMFFGVACAVALLGCFLAKYAIRKDRKKREEYSWLIPSTDIIDTGIVLGRGSFGIVTKGFYRGSHVALKKPHSRSSSGDAKYEFDETIDTEFVSIDNEEKALKKNLLHKELLTLIQLRHPNVVETLGGTIQDDQIVIVLQYMQHNTIRSVLKDPNGVAGTAGMSVEIQWALQVASGLNFLHACPAPHGPLLHNDLKSSNVLVDSSFNAAISDFGLASVTIKGLWGWINKTNKLKGSRLFLAPEILNGGIPTPASDVYSYAMFLCELLTRNRPYDMRIITGSAQLPDDGGGKDANIDALDYSTTSTESMSSMLDQKESAIPRDVARMEMKKKEHGSTIGDTSLEQGANPPMRVSFASLHDPAIDTLEKNKETPEARKVQRGSVEFGASTAMGMSSLSERNVIRCGTVGGKEYTLDEVMERVRNMTLDPPFRPDLPTDTPQILRDICMECWHKNPKRRPTMKEVEERLSIVVSNETVAQQLMRRGSMFDTILPRDLQDKLSRGESVPPQTYANATVIFSDIVDFTNTSAALSAEEVGDLIGRLLVEYDVLCRQHGVKKLDIIGDAFIGVVGVPNEDTKHASKAAAFAIDAIKASQKIFICDKKPNLGYVRVRVGIASGPVVAVVIGGAEHPKYTLFGDTVNTASRMETSGEPERCQCPEATAKLIREESSELQLEDRGIIEVKGKGKMRTFWVDQSLAT